MDAKELIQDFQIHLDRMVNEHPYYSFIVMCSCLEFLGQCLNDRIEFHPPSGSGNNFKRAAKLLPDEGYKQLDLYDTLRNGMVHTIMPKKGLWLTQRSKNEGTHLSRLEDGRIVIVVNDLLDHLKVVCKIVTESIGVTCRS